MYTYNKEVNLLIQELLCNNAVAKMISDLMLLEVYDILSKGRISFHIFLSEITIHFIARLFLN